MAFTIITRITAVGIRQTPSSISGNKAIDDCMSAWISAHNEQAEDRDSSDWDCEKAGNKAYLKAVPPLCGHKNICDFIACVNYASMTGVVTHNEAKHYLANARIALSALFHEPKPTSESGPENPGNEREK